MKRPLIGITTHGTDDAYHTELDKLVDDIVDGIERAGGIPLLIPHGINDDTLHALMGRLDGVLIPGGGDVEGGHYGETHPKIGGVDAQRDRVEMGLARLAVESGMPVFGICRGSQVLNVALGGTLHPALEEMPGVKRHDFSGDHPDDYLAHPVQVVEDSKLAHILGEAIVLVNSMHHQAVKDPAPALRVVARSPDGVIEAVEHPHHPFALGVQWHPEAMPDMPEAYALFEAFVRASAQR